MSNEPLGTVALYNFEDKRAELGRWVSYGGAFHNLESIIILHDFDFDEMKLNTVWTCTNITNDRVISFWKRFGSDDVYEEKHDYTASKNIVTKETYENEIRPRIAKLLRY